MNPWDYTDEHERWRQWNIEHKIDHYDMLFYEIVTVGVDQMPERIR